MTTLASLARRSTPVTFDEVNAVLTAAIGPQNALAAWCILAPLAISIWAPDIGTFFHYVKKYGQVQRYGQAAIYQNVRRACGPKSRSAGSY